MSKAFEAGINFFFFYGPGQSDFIEGLRPLVAANRANIIVASGSGARTANGLRTARRKILTALGTEWLDIFFAEYIHPGDHADVVFSEDGVLDQLVQWKSEGSIRYVGASAHDRSLAKRLAEDDRVDVLMHRFNMAHRKAADEVLPAALAAGTPVIAFTATRWGTLLEPRSGWPEKPPTAADCYRFCLMQQAISHVLTAPQTVAELTQNVAVLKLPRLSEEDYGRWERFGDLVYADGDHGKDEFETRWP